MPKIEENYTPEQVEFIKKTIELKKSITKLNESVKKATDILENELKTTKKQEDGEE